VHLFQGLVFFKLAKDFCFASTELSPPPQAVAKTNKLRVKKVFIDFILSILCIVIMILRGKDYNFPDAFNKSTLAIKAAYKAFI